MSDREKFERFMNEKHPRISLDRYSDPIGAAEFGRNFGDYRVPLVRYLWEFFTLGQTARESEGGEAVAYKYELATAMADGKYVGWQTRLSDHEPRVPVGSVRKLQPLYARPAPPGQESE